MNDRSVKDKPKRREFGAAPGAAGALFTLAAALPVLLEAALPGGVPWRLEAGAPFLLSLLGWLGCLWATAGLAARMGTPVGAAVALAALGSPLLYSSLEPSLRLPAAALVAAGALLLVREAPPGASWRRLTAPGALFGLAAVLDHASPPVRTSGDASPGQLLTDVVSGLFAVPASPAVTAVLLAPAALLLARGALPLTTDATSIMRPRGLTVNLLLAWTVTSSAALALCWAGPVPVALPSRAFGLLPAVPWLALVLFARPQPGRLEPAAAVRRLLGLTGAMALVLGLAQGVSRDPDWPGRLLLLMPLASALAARGMWLQGGGAGPLPPAPLVGPLPPAPLGSGPLPPAPLPHGGRGEDELRSPLPATGRGLGEGSDNTLGEGSAHAPGEEGSGNTPGSEADTRRAPSMLTRPLLAGLFLLSAAAQGYNVAQLARARETALAALELAQALEPGVPLVTTLEWCVRLAPPRGLESPRFRVRDKEALERWVATFWADGGRDWGWVSDLPDGLFLTDLPVRVKARTPGAAATRGEPLELEHLEMLPMDGPGAADAYARLAARAGRGYLARGQRREALAVLRRGLELPADPVLHGALERLMREASRG